MRQKFTKLCITLCYAILTSNALAQHSEYVVLRSERVANDAKWAAVSDKLATKHSATIINYVDTPCEALDLLREHKPRYVAIVEQPEAINRDYVIDFHCLSRTIDNDIYADFLWGIITGYDADSAMRMVDNSTEPLLIKNCVASIMELNSAKWFDNYAWVDDHTRGMWGEKRGRHNPIATDTVAKEQVLRKFTELYADFDPDLIVTAAHATQSNLEMPYSLGNIKASEGKLYAHDIFTDERWNLIESGKRRVYCAVGNCLIGDVNNSRESMAIAWLNGANAATMIGYVVTTWHGRNGWGALKYWVTNPHRYTLAEALYLNQQDFLHQQHMWYPELLTERYDYNGKFMEELTTAANRLSEVLGREVDMECAADWDMMGFWHDRDVLAYYGDPKWDVMLQSVDNEVDYKVDVKQSKKHCTITITTDKNFSMERMRGDKFKQEHVLDLPFSLFFKERLNNPRLADGEKWDAVVDENFLLIYNAEFKPNSQYRITLLTD